MARFIVRRLLRWCSCCSPSRSSRSSSSTSSRTATRPCGWPGRQPDARRRSRRSARSGASTTTSSSSTSTMMKKVFTRRPGVVLHPAAGGRGDRQGPAADAVAGDRRGDPVDGGGDLLGPLQRHAGRQVRRPVPDDRRADRDLAAGVLDRRADELLPRLQGRDLPERRLRRAHEGPGRLGLPPDPALDGAGDPVHRLLLARAADRTCSTRSTRTTCEQRAQRGCRSARSWCGTCCATR